jgi:hypothetical protein
MQASDLTDNSMLINCNPWESDSYHYYGFYEPKSTEYQIAGSEFSNPKKYTKRAFLWVENFEVCSYEMHYFPANNKQASLTLEKWDKDE